MKTKLFVRTSKKSKAAIIMIGTFQSVRTESKEAYDELMNFIQSVPHYVVKHCETCKPIYITKNGIVNRYGILVSKEPLNIEGDVEFPKGVFKRESILSFDELKEFIG